MVFERGVQSTRNGLIRLETLSWKCIFSKKNLEKLWVKRNSFKKWFLKGGPTDSEWPDSPRNTTMEMHSFSKKRKNFWWWEIFSKMVFRRGVQSAWNGVICLKLWVGGADALVSKYAGMLWQQHHWWGGGGVGGWVRKSHNAALGFFSLLSPNFMIFFWPATAALTGKLHP